MDGTSSNRHIFKTGPQTPARRPVRTWYLDRGDGSNWFVTANSLGDSFNKVVKECGFAGMAKRAHGFRSSLATKLTQESGIHVAFKQLRHASIETTVKAYVGDSTEAIQAALGKVENASQINDEKVSGCRIICRKMTLMTQKPEVVR